MEGAVTIDGGFAEVGAGLWLMGRGQPAAFFGSVSRRRRRGWIVRDRSHLNLLETAAAAKCADSSRPFLTHIPCAAPVFAVSSKILVAPAAARKDARSVKLVPMSLRNAVCVTEFVSEWVVMATVGRTARMALADDETISVRPEAAVAWTGKMPTGFCPKLSIWDILLPRGPRDLLFTFYGPSVVWIGGSCVSSPLVPRRSPFAVQRRGYGA